jgi:hypothetical protein
MNIIHYTHVLRHYNFLKSRPDSVCGNTCNKRCGNAHKINISGWHLVQETGPEIAGYKTLYCRTCSNSATSYREAGSEHLSTLEKQCLPLSVNMGFAYSRSPFERTVRAHLLKLIYAIYIKVRRIAVFANAPHWADLFKPWYFWLPIGRCLSRISAWTPTILRFSLGFLCPSNELFYSFINGSTTLCWALDAVFSFS